MRINSVDKIYVCHHTELVERKKFIIEHLSKYELEYEFVTDYLPNEINLDELQNIYPKINGYIPAYMRKLSINEISLILKHYKIWNEFEQNSELNSILVLEDDVVFIDDFIDKMNMYIKRDINYDFIFVGTCCNLNEVGTGLVRTNRGSRCTHAYMISRTCYNKIKDEMKNIQEPIDFFINVLVNKLNLNNYWLEEPVAYQNSSYKTSIIR